MRASRAISIRLLDQLIDERAIVAFADKYGFLVSKRLIDAEISQIPGTKGLNGEFSDQAYRQFLSQQQLTDAVVRQYVSADLLKRLMLTPVATNVRVPVGVATPYASMLMEAREGEAAIVPTTAFSAGLKPTDADLQSFYAANRGRYMIPEQRALRIARIGPAQVAGIVASDQEIAAYYNANQAQFGARETRNLSQAVVPDQATAAAIAARARAGGSLAAAAAPAGANAAVTTLPNQSRQAYASVAGAKPAAAAFAAASGAVVGPVQSDFGWVVVKVDSVNSQSGKTLAQAKSEIAARLTDAKRKTALGDLYNRIQNGIDDGQNFVEAAAQAKLPVETTPLIMGDGKSRANPAFQLPADLAPALKTGFDIAANDPPEIVALPGNAGFAMVSPAQVVARRPGPARHDSRPGGEAVGRPAGDGARAQARRCDRGQGIRRHIARRRGQAGRSPAARDRPGGRAPNPARRARRQGAAAGAAAVHARRGPEQGRRG